VVCGASVALIRIIYFYIKYPSGLQTLRGILVHFNFPFVFQAVPYNIFLPEL